MYAKAQKIKAFTLGEMLVVLLLTTLIVGAAFSVLQLVQGQMQSIATNYEKQTRVNLLQQSLWLDFNRCEAVWYDASQQQLFFKNENETVTYQWVATKILRETDTFYIKTKEFQVFFQGDPVPQGEIDAIDFTTDKQSGTKRLFIYKTNAATSFLNY